MQHDKALELAKNFMRSVCDGTYGGNDDTGSWSLELIPYEGNEDPVGKHITELAKFLEKNA